MSRPNPALTEEQGKDDRRLQRQLLLSLLDSLRQLSRAKIRETPSARGDADAAREIIDLIVEMMVTMMPTAAESQNATAHDDGDDEGIGNGSSPEHVLSQPAVWCRGEIIGPALEALELLLPLLPEPARSSSPSDGSGGGGSSGPSKAVDLDDEAERRRHRRSQLLITLAAVAAGDDACATLPTTTTTTVWRSGTPTEHEPSQQQEQQQQQHRAARLLRQQLQVRIEGSHNDDGNTGTTAHFIVHTVLQGYLRPLFSRSRPAALTASGRRAAFPDYDADRLGGGGGCPGLGDERERELRPWKFADWRAVPALEWAVNTADDRLVADHWALFTPALLTLLDDAATDIRRRGLVLLPRFLARLPGLTLRQTGLASVFEDAVFPTLSYLPRLTPEPESVALLGPAFEALLCIVRKLAEPAAPPPPGDNDGEKAKATGSINASRGMSSIRMKGREGRGGDGHSLTLKTKLLDRMMREGVDMAFFHASEYVRIAEVLCAQSEKIVAELGLGAVKHLKDLVPMYCTILSDPFAPLAPDTLVAAIRALQTLLETCWPRLARGVWRDEIIRALMLCWLSLSGEGSSISSSGRENWARHDGRRNDEKIQASSSPSSSSSSSVAFVQKELTTMAQLLGAVMRSAAGAGESLAEVAAPLVARDASLSRLFGAAEPPEPASL